MQNAKKPTREKRFSPQLTLTIIFPFALLLASLS